MDIRSDEARLLESAFSRARIRITTDGFENTETHALYAKTNQGRFVRYDIDWDQYNVLDRDRRAFSPIDALRANEHIVPRSFTRSELLPSRTFWEETRESIIPSLRFSVLLATTSYLFHNLLGAMGYVKNHVTMHAAPANPATHVLRHTQSAHAVLVDATKRLQHAAGPSGAAQWFEDADMPGMYNDDMVTDRLEQERLRNEQRTAFCRLHPEQCRPDGYMDLAAGAVVGAIGGHVGTRLYDAAHEPHRARR
jgi:hypothetical protein